MDMIIVWFIMTAGTGPLPPPGGYIEPLNVRPADLTCLPGSMTSVQVDRPVNPTVVMVPHPQLPDQHCRVDIRGKVATLAHGEYHAGTTYVAKTRHFGSPDDKPEPYIMPDPHTSTTWRVGPSDSVGRPGNARVGPPSP